MYFSSYTAAMGEISDAPAPSLPPGVVGQPATAGALPPGLHARPNPGDLVFVTAVAGLISLSQGAAGNASWIMIVTRSDGTLVELRTSPQGSAWPGQFDGMPDLGPAVTGS
jgi:hypothetical protein